MGRLPCQRNRTAHPLLYRSPFRPATEAPPKRVPETFGGLTCSRRQLLAADMAAISRCPVCRIPKGFCQSAQGCESASYPGSVPSESYNPVRVAATHEPDAKDTHGHNPVGVDEIWSCLPRVA